MGGPGFMRTRIRTTGPNLESGPQRVTGKPPCPLPVHPSGPVYSRGPERAHARTATSGPASGGPGIVKNFVLKRCTSGTVYVNNL